MESQIGSVRERVLEVGAREGVVDDRQSLSLMRDVGQGADVEHFEQRVGRRLDPHQARRLPQRLPHTGEPAHVHRRRGDAELIEDADE